jgi:hypothetical protein
MSFANILCVASEGAAVPMNLNACRLVRVIKTSSYSTKSFRYQFEGRCADLDLQSCGETCPRSNLDNVILNVQSKYHAGEDIFPEKSLSLNIDLAIVNTLSGPQFCG